MEKILITELQYEKGRQVFEACTDFECIKVSSGESHLCESVRRYRARYVVVGLDSYGGTLCKTLPAGGVIARYGVGHDNIDKREATKHRVLCTNTPGVLHDSVAEYTVGLILAAGRHIPAQHQRIVAGGWTPVQGIELKGKTVAVIGAGRIGTAVARILKHGFGCTVVVMETDETKRKQLERESFVDRVAGPFEEAVDRADFVSLHIPGSVENHHFVDARRIAAMKPSAWLINTARGNVVDEVALHEALSAGKIAGVALDVFEKEPYEPISPEHDLRKLDNVLMLPHSASNTLEACNAMAVSALNNIRFAATGAFEKMNIINPDVLKSLDDEE